jgi:hypothetical protein
MSRRHRFISVLAGLLLTVTAIVAPAASAATQSASQPGLVVVQTGTGSYGWAANTYIAAHPGFAAAHHITLASAGGLASPAALATPMSHFGCHISVCVDVSGSGLHVNYWNTHALGNVGCSTPYFIENNAVIIYGHQVCPNLPVDGTYFYAGPTNQYYFNNTSLCNNWSGFGGEIACAIVHS